MTQRKLGPGVNVLRRHFILYGPDGPERQAALAEVHSIQRQLGWPEVDPLPCRDHTEHTMEVFEAEVKAINEWQPRPPMHAPGGLARMTPEREAKLAKILGPEEAHYHAVRINAWVEEREAQKAAGKHATLWTPERLESDRKRDAERARRYRERKRKARQRLTKDAVEA